MVHRYNEQEIKEIKKTEIKQIKEKIINVTMAVKSSSGKIKRGHYKKVTFERTHHNCKYNLCYPERNRQTEKKEYYLENE